MRVILHGQAAQQRDDGFTHSSYICGSRVALDDVSRVPTWLTFTACCPGAQAPMRALSQPPPSPGWTAIALSGLPRLSHPTMLVPRDVELS